MTICNSQPFVTEPEAKVIWRSSIPMIGAILALFAYDLLESSLLAFQSEDVLTAFGFTLPITAAMTALAIGLSIRTNNKVVHSNCKNKQQLASGVSQSLTSGVLTVALVSLLFFLFSHQLLQLTGSLNWQENTATKAQINDQVNYLNFRLLAWVFLALFWQISATFRALGWMKIASNLMLGWALVKSLIAIVILTPQSPFYQSGLTSLGLIHLFVDTLFASVSFYLLAQKVTLKRPDLSNMLNFARGNHLDSVLVVSQQFITPVSMAALTAIAATIDHSYVAALALLFRLEALFLLLPMVLTTTVPAIIGANYWLGHKQRVRNMYRVTFGAIAGFQLLIAIVVYSQSHLLSAFICPHDMIAFHVNNFISWLPWAYGAAGIAIVYQSCLNAQHKTLQATLLAFSHRILFVLPLSAIGAFAFGENGFYQGLMLGHFGAIIGVVYLFKRVKKQEHLAIQKPQITAMEGISKG